MRQNGQEKYTDRKELLLSLPLWVEKNSVMLQISKKRDCEKLSSSNFFVLELSIQICRTWIISKSFESVNIVITWDIGYNLGVFEHGTTKKLTRKI